MRGGGSGSGSGGGGGDCLHTSLKKEQGYSGFSGIHAFDLNGKSEKGRTAPSPIFPFFCFYFFFIFFFIIIFVSVFVFCFLIKHWLIDSLSCHFPQPLQSVESTHPCRLLLSISLARRRRKEWEAGEGEDRKCIVIVGYRKVPIYHIKFYSYCGGLPNPMYILHFTSFTYITSHALRYQTNIYFFFSLNAQSSKL